MEKTKTVSKTRMLIIKAAAVTAAVMLACSSALCVPVKAGPADPGPGGAMQADSIRTDEASATNTQPGRPVTDSRDGIIARITVKDSTNLLEGPGSSYAAVTKAGTPGYRLSVIDLVYNRESGEYYLETVWDGHTGWIPMSAANVVRNKEDSIPVPDFYVRTTTTAKLYTSADTSGSVITTVPGNTQLHVSDMSGGSSGKQCFVYTTYGNDKGWVSLDSAAVLKTDIYEPEQPAGQKEDPAAEPVPASQPEKVLYRATVYNTNNTGLELHVSDTDASGNIIIPEGAQITVNEIRDDGKGIVTYQDQKGWVNLRYTKVSMDYPAQEPSYGFMSETEYFIENTSGAGLQLRTGPSPDTSSYGVMPEGSIVIVKAVCDGWAYLSYNGKNGWAGYSYLGGPQEPFRVTVFDTSGQGSVLKASPDSNSGTIAWIPEGTGLIIRHEISYCWGYTIYNGVSGWIYLGQTKVDGSYPSFTPSYGFVDVTKCIVTGTGSSGLNLRVGPTADFCCYGKLPEDTIISVSAVNGDWAYAEYNGQRGWVNIMYIEEYPRKIRLTRVLSEGMQGDDVYAVQERLYDLGYLSIYPDGVFGWQTTEAVNSFQKINLLGYQTGKVDDWMADKLNSNPRSYSERVPDAVYAQCYAAYRQLLENEKRQILAYDGLTDGAEPRNIVIADICGDELPELIYSRLLYPADSDDCPAVLYIMAYRNGEAQVIYYEKLDKAVNESGYWHSYIYREWGSRALYGYHYYGEWDGNGIEEFYRYSENSDGTLSKALICYSEWDKDGIFLYCESGGVQRNTPGYYEVTGTIQNYTREIGQHNDGCGRFVDDFVRTYGSSALTFNEAINVLSQQ